MRINQLLPVVSQRKKRAQVRLTELFRTLDHEQSFQGLTRRYQPLDDEGERLPPEEKRVTATAPTAIELLSTILAPLWDSVATLDASNAGAIGNIVVGEETLVSGVRGTTLIYIEKQLIDVRTFLSKVPVLDTAHEWVPSSLPGCFETHPVETTRAKKVPRNHVLSEATDHHQAQVQIINEDKIVGNWQTKLFSGGISETDRTGMVNRLDLLVEAVKIAREQANAAETKPVALGADLLSFILYGE